MSVATLAIIAAAAQPAQTAPETLVAAATSTRNRTPEEIAAVRASAAACRAEMNAKHVVQRVNVRPSYRTGEYLTAARRTAREKVGA